MSTCPTPKLITELDPRYPIVSDYVATASAANSGPAGKSTVQQILDLASQATAIVSTVTPPRPNGPGVIWINPTDNSVYYWDGSAWIPLENAGGGGGNKVTVSPNAPNNNILGDIWVTPEGVISVWDGSQWITSSVSENDPYSPKVASAAPTDPGKTGVIWINSTDDSMSYWDGVAWLPLTAGGGGGPGAVVSPTAPENPESGTIWTTPEGVTLIWNGSEWVSPSVDVLAEIRGQTIEPSVVQLGQTGRLVFDGSYIVDSAAGPAIQQGVEANRILTSKDLPTIYVQLDPPSSPKPGDYWEKTSTTATVYQDGAWKTVAIS